MSLPEYERGATLNEQILPKALEKQVNPTGSCVLRGHAAYRLDWHGTRSKCSQQERFYCR